MCKTTLEIKYEEADVRGLCLERIKGCTPRTCFSQGSPFRVCFNSVPHGAVHHPEIIVANSYRSHKRFLNKGCAPEGLSAKMIVGGRR